MLYNILQNKEEFAPSVSKILGGKLILGESPHPSL